VITSGGGFGRYNRPSYQDAAVQGYLSNGRIPIPPSSYFNRNGRGYPDVSGYANNYIVNMGGKTVSESGTSASTPLLAAMITLWNDMRITNGLSPLGFINPLMYQIAASHPDVFNDIVTGDNKCVANYRICCNDGFVAAAGWDPTTGLGSPKFVEMANVLLNPSVSFPFSPAASLPSSNEPLATATRARWALGLSITALVLSIVLFGVNQYMMRQKRTSLNEPLNGS